MSYELAFLDVALKEWRKLDANIRDQFRKKLAERLENPRAPSAQLYGAKDRYKVKLRSAGYRLVYEVRDAQLIVLERRAINVQQIRLGENSSSTPVA